MRSLKIALVSPYDHSVAGGVRSHIVGLDKEFRAQGHTVKILAPASDEANLAPNVICVSDHVVPVGVSGSKARITLSLSVWRTVKRILREEQFDVVHIHEPLMPTLPIFVLRHSRSVTIGTFHAYRESYFGYNYTKVILRRLMHRLDARAVVSPAVLPYVTQYFPGHYEIVPNGIDIEKFGAADIPPLKKFMDGKLNILFVGRLDKRKGFRNLLQAFHDIKQQVPEARLIVAGAYSKDDKEEYVRTTRQSGLRDVKFVGYIPSDELPSYYRTAHVFCAPSTGFESFGLVLLEAMAAGAPLVASDIPGYRSVVHDGQEGLLVPPENEPALASAIVRLLKDEPLRRQMSEAGRRTAAQYSWTHVAQCTLDLYERCITRRRAQQSDSELHAAKAQESAEFPRTVTDLRL
ncbi:MAG: glycosyltransferase family 4 protein [Chloroflexi bacterium]|nr:glycosyltransferase family 4 protein [Chloroflexota bacterium]MBI3731969.1 glycosyltransferase family 4 protein [Chloroflexota bacterium]